MLQYNASGQDLFDVNSSSNPQPAVKKVITNSDAAASYIPTESDDNYVQAFYNSQLRFQDLNHQQSLEKKAFEHVDFNSSLLPQVCVLIATVSYLTT
jgi:hypothetical protein